MAAVAADLDPDAPSLTGSPALASRAAEQRPQLGRRQPAPAVWTVARPGRRRRRGSGPAGWCTARRGGSPSAGQTSRPSAAGPALERCRRRRGSVPRPTSIAEPPGRPRAERQRVGPGAGQEARVRARWRRSRRSRRRRPAGSGRSPATPGRPVDREPSGTSFLRIGVTWVRRQSVTCLVIGNALPSCGQEAGNCSNVAFSEVSRCPRSPGASTAASSPRRS